MKQLDCSSKRNREPSLYFPHNSSWCNLLSNLQDYSKHWLPGAKKKHKNIVQTTKVDHAWNIMYRLRPVHYFPNRL